VADAIEQIDGEPFPDPFTGDHNIEYWLWTGSRLVPASPETAERLQRQEALEQEEFRLLRERQRACRQQRWQAYKNLVHWLLSPLRGVVERWQPWPMRAYRSQERTTDR
jgi:hypothetical protein